MRRLVIIFLVLAALMLGLIQLMQMGTGYVLVAFHGWTLETTVWLAVVVLMVFFLLLYFVLRSLINLIFAKGKLRQWAGGRKAVKQNKQQQQALLAYMTGDYDKAAPVLGKLAKQDMNPEVNYLLAASAEQARGDAEKGQQWLNQAEQAGLKPTIAAKLTQAQLYLNQGEAQKALEMLQGIPSKTRQQTQVLGLLAQIYQQQEKYYALVELIPEIRKTAYLNGQKSEQLIERICQNWLLSADDVNPDELQQRWQKLGKAEQGKNSLIALYANALVKAGAASEAAELVKVRLKTGFDEALVAVFGRIPGKQPKKHLKLVQEWLQQRPDNSALLLAAGRLALAADEVEQAKKYLQASLQQRPTTDGFAELARLHSHMGELQQSTDCYQQSLALATVSRSGLPVPDSTSTLS